MTNKSREPLHKLSNVFRKSSLENANTILDIVQKIVFIIGIPLTIYTYFTAKEKERKEKEYFVYDNMDKKYWEYQLVRDMMFLQISLYERAYIMYADGESEFRKTEWVGWSSSLNRWLHNKRFIDAWNIGGPDYDQKFQNYMNEQIEKVNSEQK